MSERIVPARVNVRTGRYVVPDEIEHGRRMARWHFQRWLERDTLVEHDYEEEAHDGSND